MLFSSITLFRENADSMKLSLHRSLFSLLSSGTWSNKYLHHALLPVSNKQEYSQSEKTRQCSGTLGTRGTAIAEVEDSFHTYRVSACGSRSQQREWQHSKKMKMTSPAANEAGMLTAANVGRLQTPKLQSRN